MIDRALSAAVRMLRTAGAAALAASCPCCGQPMGWGRFGVCPFCWKEVVASKRPACRGCGRRILAAGAVEEERAFCGACLGDERSYEALAAYGSYESRLRDLIRALKYKHRPGLARPLGAWIAEGLRAAVPEVGFDDAVIVPVPIARARLAARGYNQARLLAREVARRLRRSGAGRPKTVDALERTRERPPQTSLPRRDRLKAQAGLYAVRPRRREAVAGRTVLLVDDVYTTGATVRACARVLRRAGSDRVFVAVAARTPSPREIMTAIRMSGRTVQPMRGDGGDGEESTRIETA